MKEQSTGIRTVLIVCILVFSIIFAGCLSNSSPEMAKQSDSNMPSSDQVDNGDSKKSSNTAVDGDVPMPTMAEKKEAAPRGTPSKTKSDRYEKLTENPFLETSRAPLSTFSIDVDTASYANARRYLNDGMLPPKDAIRIEEFINYFEYDYPQPIGNIPFSVNTEVAKAPWKTNHKIVRIGLQGKKSFA